MNANGFRHFLYFAIYFPHPNSNNSNIETLIGLIVLQTCLCYDKVLEVNVFRLCFGIFTFVATKMAFQKLS